MLAYKAAVHLPSEESKRALWSLKGPTGSGRVACYNLPHHNVS